MTIKREWTVHIPVINKDIQRSKVVDPGYREVVSFDTSCGYESPGYGRGGGMGYTLEILDEDTLRLTYNFPYKEDDPNRIQPRIYREEQINDNLFHMIDSDTNKDIRYCWEPTLPPQSRK